MPLSEEATQRLIARRKELDAIIEASGSDEVRATMYGLIDGLGDADCEDQTPPDLRRTYRRARLVGAFWLVAVREATVGDTEGMREEVMAALLGGGR